VVAAFGAISPIASGLENVGNPPVSAVRCQNKDIPHQTHQLYRHLGNTERPLQRLGFI
jgi:hypothetical protein